MADRVIKKEVGFFGGKKEVIYENGVKKGEILEEKTWYGKPVKREYNNDGKLVTETFHETTIFSTPVDRTYDPEGSRISETRHELTLTGRYVDRTYDNDGNIISETRKENTFLEGRIKRVSEKINRTSDRGSIDDFLGDSGFVQEGKGQQSAFDELSWYLIIGGLFLFFFGDKIQNYLFK